MLTYRLAGLTRRATTARMTEEHWAVEAGFRPGCIGVLHTVAHHEPVSQREVSERLGLDPSDLVSLVDILDRAGLVQRRRDPTDRRRVLLEITAAGRTAVRRLEAVSRAVTDEVLAPLDADQRELLEDLLHRVVDHHTAGGSERWVGPMVEPVSRARGRGRRRAGR